MQNESGVQVVHEREVATLGGGCFWCVEAVLTELKGVDKVEPGYSGGRLPNPTYEQVCSESTNHAEVVQVTYDPKILSYADLLRVFFTVHDPTTLNRQGNDVGTSYRSIILCHGPDQRRIAEEVIREVNESKIYKNPVVTQVVDFEVFYPAEGYHKDYFKRNPYQPYCQFVIAPKVAKFRKHYFDRLKKE